MKRRSRSGDYWTIPREWENQTAFIVAGGPSALQQSLELLRGRKVIAINARYQEVPFADFVFGMDQQFFKRHEAELRKLDSRVVTTAQSVSWPGVLKVRQATAPGHDDPQSVYCGCTSMAGAMDFARQLGATREVLIGADGHDTPEARKHHSQRYPHHPHRQGRYRDWRQIMERLAKRMRERGIEILNASPGSAYGDLWPIVKLEDTMTTPFNPNEFHDDLVSPSKPVTAEATPMSPGLVAAMDAARVSLAKSDAKGKDAVKLASVHLRALLDGVAA